MEMRLIWVLIPVLGLGVAGCGQKEDAAMESAAELPSVVVEDAVVEVVPEPVVLSVAERAEMHGFARYLPQDVEMMLSVHDGLKLVSRVMASPLVAELTGGEAGDPAEVERGLLEQSSMGMFGPAEVFGREVTLAVGAGGLADLGKLSLLNRRSGYFNMRDMVRMVDGVVTDGEGMAFEVDGCSEVNLLTGDEQIPPGAPAGLELFGEVKLPPIYLAFKVAAEDKREATAQVIGSGLDMLTMIGGPEVAAVEMAHGDDVFSGYTLPGSFFAMLVDNQRDEFAACGASSEKVDTLVELLKAKKITLMKGVVGEYVVIFIGTAAEDFRLAEAPEDSLLAGDALAFADAYQDKELVSCLHLDREAAVAIHGDGNVLLGDFAAGVRDGLAMADHLGDTRSLQVMLGMLAEREEQLLELITPDGLDAIAYHEDGIILEAFGGSDSGAFAWDQPNRLSSLGLEDGVAMFLNYCTDAVYDRKARAYFEVLLETMYAGAMKVAELPVAEQELIQFRSGAMLFDAKFRDDLVGVWGAVSNGFGGGLGLERAWVVDLDGEAPAVPGLPQPVVDEMRVPRLSVVAPVVDRSRLGDAWGRLNTSLTSLLSSGGEMAGMPLPMQKPLSSEKDGFKTWFLAMPFINDDFVPSVTLNDEWFAASSSKLQAVDLLARAAAGGEPGRGCRLWIDFKPLHEYALETIGVLKQHMADNGISASDLEQARSFAAACSGLDSFSLWVRREEGMLRTTVQFKTR